jgi:ceramide glucosyltransferase
MHLTITTALEIVTSLGTVATLFYYALSAAGLMSFLRTRGHSQPATNLPPLTILKPLKGVDPQIWKSFVSHCEQDYPQLQLIFGVSDPDDPAIALVRKLQKQFPTRQIDLLECPQILGTNVKVSNLVQMLPAARHEILLVNDSDIRVPHDYLRRVVEPLADWNVGLVTCLYRGIAAKTVGSRLEAIGIATDFVPGVLSARFLEKGVRFALGSTMAFRRSDLAAIGGFEVLLDYLADDYELGSRIAAKGKKVELSSVVVDTFLPAYSFSEFLDHQLRWWRTIRDARRGGYLGLLFTFGLPWALATVIAARGAAWSWLLFAITVAARLTLGLGTALRALEDRQPLLNIFLLPMRDLLAPLLWAAGLVGNRIHWRGEEFNLKNGRLTRIAHEQLR